jgi:hypothetical protein
MNIKLAFAGKMGSGKDTAVKYLINNYKGKKFSFAEPIYDILYYSQKICGFPIEKDRKFLQMVGSDWAREKDVNVWINILLNKTNNNLHNYYISDLRFDTEFEALRKNGWICIKIINKNTEINREGTGKKNHISETSLDIIDDCEWDYIIENNDTIENFYKKLDLIYIGVINKKT